MAEFSIYDTTLGWLELTQDNGILIENNLQQTRVKLAVLQTSVASDGVYRPDGKLRPLSNTRTFGAL